MSFDVFLQKFAGGKPAGADRERVVGVIKTAKYWEANGSFLVEFPDGVQVTFSVDDLTGPSDSTAYAFFIRGMSPPSSEVHA